MLAKWFADTERFAPGEPVRMDFGDGDFFSGRVIEWDPGIILGLRWKFVGCGPEYEVRFSMLRRKGGTELTVQDRGAITVEEAECLRVGWSEFLMRFEKIAAEKGQHALQLAQGASNFTSWIETGAAGHSRPRSTTAVVRERRSRVRARTDPRAARENEIAAAITQLRWGDVETRARVKLKNIRGVDYAYRRRTKVGRTARPHRGERAPAFRRGLD